MSTETKPLTPLTLSAERLQQIVKLAYGYDDRALLELLKELDARTAAHAATQEHLAGAIENADDIAVKLGVDCEDREEMTPAQTWHASVQAIKALRERLAQAQRGATLRDAIDAAMEANTKALRTKPDQAVRPAGDADAVGFEGGKPNE